ncbi:GATA transcription factor 1-like [Andrographis paniculata]|uniref:GATA transcription factor 1-like n=1 Tax=Andrographis paniculata TaxID=175694 RepID=UPI0021E82B49|nr:GATA transcription factor 1-like [Andrographis paniculata]
MRIPCDSLSMETEASTVKEELFCDDFIDFNFGEGDAAIRTEFLKGGSAAVSFSSGLELSKLPPDFGQFPEIVQEELEWVSNKEAFPGLDEAFFGILSENQELSIKNSPVSVLEDTYEMIEDTYKIVKSYFNSMKLPSTHPVRPRSKRTRERRVIFDELAIPQRSLSNETSSSLGKTEKTARRCWHCQTDHTPQWRAGPMGAKTLCNACGVRYKSGRLLPEYRPANSPTFSSSLHSNSHRKVVEMRRQKQLQFYE